jgi:hypothetical protein
VGGSGHKHAIALYGILAVSLRSRNGPDPKDAVARRDHEEVTQGCVPMHPPGLGCIPTRYTAVVQPTSLRMASLLPVAVTSRVTATSAFMVMLQLVVCCNCLYIFMVMLQYFLCHNHLLVMLRTLCDITTPTSSW